MYSYQYVILVVVLFAGMGFASWDPTMQPLFTTPQTGSGTYYGVSTSGGTCTLQDPSPAVASNPLIYSTVALNIGQWDNSIPCGMCMNVTASGVGSGATPIVGNFLVFVNNQCPSCPDNGDLDFALTGDGKWAISWVAVECPVGSGLFQYLFAGSNPYYIKLQVRNTRIPALKLSIQQGSNWVSLPKTNDNFFEGDGSLATPVSFPISIMIESVAGDVVYDTIASLGDGSALVDGLVQFPSVSNNTSTSSSGASSGSGVSTVSGASTVSGVSSSSGVSTVSGVSSGTSATTKPSNIVSSNATTLNGTLFFALVFAAMLSFM